MFAYMFKKSKKYTKQIKGGNCMFGFKKILKELIEMRKEIEEIKKNSNNSQIKDEPKPKREKNTKRVGRGKIDYRKVENEIRYPTDISIAQLAQKMKVDKYTLNNRVNYLLYAGERWANDKRHVYYVNVKGVPRPVKYLSLYAQDRLMDRYGIGYNHKYSKKEK